jgi:hypothetical protein
VDEFVENGMPKGPKGEKRPADVIGAAIMAAKIATGEITETVVPAENLIRCGMSARMGYDAR